MRWAAQVAHVARTDLVRLRHWTVGYLVATAATTAIVIHSTITLRSTGLTVLLLVPLAVGIVVLLMRDGAADGAIPSPSTFALAPSAVLTAKLAFVLLVPVGIPLVGTAAVLWVYRLDAQTSGGVLLEGLWRGLRFFAVAMLIAAHTRSVRAFVAAFIVFGLGAGPVGELALRMYGLLPVWPAIASGLLTIAAAATTGVALLNWARPVTRLPRMTTLVAALALTAVAWFVGDAPRIEAAEPGVDPAGSIADFVIDADGHRIGDRRLAATFTMDSTSPHRLSLLRAHAEVRSPDGRLVTMRRVSNEVTIWRPPEPVEGLRFYRSPFFGAGNSPSVLKASIDAPFANAIRPQGASVSVDATIRRSAARLVGDVPLVDSLVTSGMHRFRVVRATTDSGRPLIELRMMWIGELRAESAFDPRFGFILANRARGEAFQLQPLGGSGFSMILPSVGAHAANWERELTWRALPFRPDSAVRIDREWLASARLLVFEWVPVRTYRTRMTATLKPAGVR